MRRNTARNKLASVSDTSHYIDDRAIKKKVCSFQKEICMFVAESERKGSFILERCHGIRLGECHHCNPQAL
ncbi:hypothetical protein GN956_G2597 [Arapaima gigas]